MDLASRYKGVVGLVFGNDNSASNEDSYVERLLDRISNGVLAEDRRTAMAELQSIVAESNAAQLAFGAMGFPVVMGVLKEERDDIEMIRGALETLVSALTPIDHAKGTKNEVQPALMNTDLLSREAENISLLLSLLKEEDFYVRYYTLQILTALLTNSPNRLQEAILTILVVIRNEALLLLTYLTREAEEIQKIVVFEGAFEKIFSIIKEEGGSEGGVVVQKKVLDYLLMLGVESQWAPIAVRCTACIGNLIAGHPKNLDALATKVLGEEPQVEPALNSILRIILRTSSMQEFTAADHVFKSFCETNSDSQTMLASTLIPQPHSMTNAPIEEDVNMSFGSMLLHGLTLSESDGDLETCCRAASVLSHVLKDNIQCKERVLRIELESPMSSLGAAEPLMHRMVKYLALASNMKNKDGKSSSTGNSYVQLIILKLLVTWMADCSTAVQCFLDSRPHLTYLLELVSNPSATVCIRGLAAVLLGECVIYNKSSESGKDALTVVDAISQKVGLASYFLKFDEMMKSFIFSPAKPTEPHKPLTRSAAASMEEIEMVETDIRETIAEIYSRPKNEVAVVPAELDQKGGESDKDYIKRLKSFVEKQCSEIQWDMAQLENVKKCKLKLPCTGTAILTHSIQSSWSNATLAEELAKIGGNGSSQTEQRASGGSERVQAETLRRDLQEASQRIEMLKADKAKIESEASMYQNLAGKMESDLKSLSDAYNSLEQANFHLEKEVKALKDGGASTVPDIEAIKEEAREEAQKESEAELNDLLVCLGQEQSRVEKLTARLLELGEDVDKLLEGIGDDMGLPEDGEEEED
ncbi:hypothetical protein GH714_018396 [Hevea brasiliensis]|uniref:Golgin candidate 6 n=1 Tax=Hevea brasiliensis TaxID=3981 RepID=A0A6A6KWE1_HEVBR|nr:hypothetical protein GH714_018396 [Hevea brasiliensis]